LKYYIASAEAQDRVAAKIITWNSVLRDKAAKFSADHQDATVMLFSSWDTFTRVFDSPEVCGFKAGDLRKRGGKIWVDHIHPSSRMHRIVADDIFSFLLNQAAQIPPLTAENPHNAND
jgi:phospholipase/lecithinase/hemolysin